MRAFAVGAALLFMLPIAAASPSYEHHYLMLGQGCAGGGVLIRNCETYFPDRSLTSIDVEAEDVSGESISLRICHEWTYDDGSHARVVCNAGCSPSFGDALSHPPWPHNTTYRVIVDLRGNAGACGAEASAGTLRVSFT